MIDSTLSTALAFLRAQNLSVPLLIRWASNLDADYLVMGDYKAAYEHP